MRWHDTCTRGDVCQLCQSCQCLVCLASCRNSPKEQQSESDKMSSKTILIGLGFFGDRCGGEKFFHGRPSWELAPYDSSSQNIEDFAAWCKVVSKECRLNDRAGECEVVRFTTPFFILDMAKALPVRIGSQTA